LHVIANSDSSEDQILKLKVRDKVLEYMSSISNNVKSKEDWIVLLNKNLANLNTVSSQTIYENGYNYGYK